MSDSSLIKYEATKLQQWVSQSEPIQIEQLYDDIEQQAAHSYLAVILNHPPKQSWIKKHPVAKTDYLPIDKIEWLLTYFFGDWWVEVRDTKIMANSVAVTIRLYYRDPLRDGNYKTSDGVGAVALQLDKDSAASDVGKIKSSAVQIGLPAAESYAFKDAAEKIGKIFGKDLNRKEPLEYYAMVETKDGAPRFTTPEEITEPDLTDPNNPLG